MYHFDEFNLYGETETWDFSCVHFFLEMKLTLFRIDSVTLPQFTYFSCIRICGDADYPLFGRMFGIRIGTK